MISKDTEQVPVFAAGLISGSICTLAIISIANDANIWDWMLSNQSLSAGLLGTFAALTTTLFFLWQIRQKYQIRNDEQERKLDAARCVLPLALAELRSYGDTCFRQLTRIARFEDETLNVPELNDEILGTIKECIESSDIDERAALSNFIRLLQVQMARIRALSSEFPTRCFPNRNVHGAVDQDEVDRWLTYEAGGALDSTCELLLFIDELWRIARPSEDREPMPARSVRIRNIFTFHNERPDSWPNFIRSF